MKNSTVWVTGGILLLCIVTTFDYQDHPQRWRFQVMAVTTILLFLFFLVGLISVVRKKRKD
ncbi:MAG: hypothetical protein IPQ08_14495 [Chitinophagaceae bacterium]|nr:hypothetical protein [Chitinophagaceae bacterium]